MRDSEFFKKVQAGSPLSSRLPPRLILFSSLLHHPLLFLFLPQPNHFIPIASCPANPSSLPPHVLHCPSFLFSNSYLLPSSSPHFHLLTSPSSSPHPTLCITTLIFSSPIPSLHFFFRSPPPLPHFFLVFSFLLSLLLFLSLTTFNSTPPPSPLSLVLFSLHHPSPHHLSAPSLSPCLPLHLLIFLTSFCFCPSFFSPLFSLSLPYLTSSSSSPHPTLCPLWPPSYLLISPPICSPSSTSPCLTSSSSSPPLPSSSFSVSHLSSQPLYITPFSHPPSLFSPLYFHSSSLSSSISSFLLPLRPPRPHCLSSSFSSLHVPHLSSPPLLTPLVYLLCFLLPLLVSTIYPQLCLHLPSLLPETQG